MTLRTNQSTVLPWRRKYIRALGNTVFLLVRLIMYCREPIRIQYCSDVEIVFFLSNSYIGVSVISVRIRILKVRILHASTINKRIMTLPWAVWFSTNVAFKQLFLTNQEQFIFGSPENNTFLKLCTIYRGRFIKRDIKKIFVQGYNVTIYCKWNNSRIPEYPYTGKKQPWITVY